MNKIMDTKLKILKGTGTYKVVWYWEDELVVQASNEINDIGISHYRTVDSKHTDSYFMYKNSNYAKDFTTINQLAKSVAKMEF